MTIVLRMSGVLSILAALPVAWSMQRATSLPDMGDSDLADLAPASVRFGSPRASTGKDWITEHRAFWSSVPPAQELHRERPVEAPPDLTAARRNLYTAPATPRRNRGAIEHATWWLAHAERSLGLARQHLDLLRGLAAGAARKAALARPLLTPQNARHLRAQHWQLLRSQLEEARRLLAERQRETAGTLDGVWASIPLTVRRAMREQGLLPPRIADRARRLWARYENLRGPGQRSVLEQCELSRGFVTETLDAITATSNR